MHTHSAPRAETPTTDGALPLIEMRQVTKRFGALVACDAIDLQVAAGALHAIMGENGAGKTTLMRMLYGYYAPDGGEIYLRGKRVQFRSPADAIAHHIGMVSQHYSIIPELSALDNLILGAEPTRVAGWLDRAAARARAEQLADALEFQPDWNRPAADLSVAARQKLEILKLLWRDAEILILDEPTAMLSPRDVDTLFEVLMRLKAQGRTILLVTHKLNEALRYADCVTVLRGGRKIADSPTAAVDAQTLTRWIIGEDANALIDTESAFPRAEVKPAPPQPSPQAGRETLLLRDLYVASDRGGWEVQSTVAPKPSGMRLTYVASERSGWGVQGLSLTVRAGEIVGIAGVDGSGQAELMEALAGLRPVARGEILLQGAPMHRWSTARRIQAGVRYLFDDRFRRMMAPQWSVLENAILGAQRDPDLQTLGWFKPRAVRQRAEQLVQRFQVKIPSLRAPIVQLSGGNQQRLVIARALHGNPRLLIAYAPTRGLDIRGAQATYEAIRAACQQGMAALVIAFDLDELMEHCDRIAVLFKGTIVQEFTREAFSREAIGAAMVGATLQEATV
ncbi:MAG: ABC transporter ATP-binding protein [Fimbriimonadales bacterium]|nr:MAG: ABC transporter [Fimbriimonadales bacterium]